jgi:D-amino peptidase
VRVLIIADMEGVIGIDVRNACNPREPEYERGRQLLADEVNLVAAAAREAGATSVSVIDWHAGGGNLTAELLQGVDIVAEDFGPDYDVVLLTGFHAMAGAQDAFIPHTMNQITTLEVNGTLWGETAILSRWAGDHGVPVALVSGDDAAISEAAALLPETSAVSVKTAISPDQADCLPINEASETLRAAVMEALSNRETWSVYAVESPIKVRYRLDPEPGSVALIPWLQRQEDSWLAGQVDNVHDIINLIDLFNVLRRG